MSFVWENGDLPFFNLPKITIVISIIGIANINNGICHIILSIFPIADNFEQPSIDIIARLDPSRYEPPSPINIFGC